jgi:TM2 domain-containing membrane protein YozV
MKFKIILCWITLFLFYLSGYSQNPVNPNFLFIDFLTENNKNREALHLLSNTNELSNSDTVNYLKGMNYYLLKKTDSAALSFNLVAPASNFYTKSKFFESINLSYSKKYKPALTTFSDFSKDTVQKYSQLINIVSAGNYLLLRDYKRFDSLSVGFLYNDYNYSNEQSHLVDLKNRSLKLKKKSPFVAGALSAVVPGLGKFYAGKKGAGLAAFAANGALAAMAFESYYRTKSFKSPQFITFTTLFSFFYVGNIFGSVFSIKQQIKSVNGKINNEILASIHVPVVRIFK